MDEVVSLTGNIPVPKQSEALCVSPVRIQPSAAVGIGDGGPVLPNVTSLLKAKSKASLGTHASSLPKGRSMNASGMNQYDRFDDIDSPVEFSDSPVDFPSSSSIANSHNNNNNYNNQKRNQRQSSNPSNSSSRIPSKLLFTPEPQAIGRDQPSSQLTDISETLRAERDDGTLRSLANPQRHQRRGGSNFAPRNDFLSNELDYDSV